MKFEAFCRAAMTRDTNLISASGHTARGLRVLAAILALGGCSSAAETPATPTTPTGTSVTPVTTPTVSTPVTQSPTTTMTGTSTTPTAPVNVPVASATAGVGGNVTPVTPPVVTPVGTDPTPTAPVATLPEDMGTPTLYWLAIIAKSATTAASDGGGAKPFAMGTPLPAPDGVTVDPVGKHVFILNMGVATGGANNGSLFRFNLDGTGFEEIMKAGTKVGNDTFNTGKQVTIDRMNNKLYLGDREGSKVWRCDLDGKNLEVLVSAHGIMQVVGVAADPMKNEFYFSDRNGKKLFKANMKMPDGKTHADRDDLTLLYVDKAPNAMPLDLELDLKTRTLFWTDRQQNKVFSMPMDLPAGQDPMTRTDVKTVASNLTDVIGLGYDHQEGVLYATHSMTVSRFKTDGSDLKKIGTNGTTGIAFARIQ